MVRWDKFLEEREEEDYPIAIQKVNVLIYDTIEAQKEKSGGGKVTVEIMKLMKKCFDYINIRLVKAHRESVANETKVRTMITDSKAYEALVRRVSGGLPETSKLQEFPTLRKTGARRDQGFSVMVTPKEGDDVSVVKKDLRQVWRDTADVPTPHDVASTKSGQLILRMKTKEDTDKLKNVIENAEVVKDKVTVSVARRRRRRLLVLSVDGEAVVKDVRNSVERVLEDGGLDGTCDVDIIRHYPTRSGKENWIIDVDEASAELLLMRRRICVNLERYRVVEFVQILRCFRCQAFGYVASKCSDDQKCVKCAGTHGLKDCSVTVESCTNCIRKDDDCDSAHRADSVDCPCYQEYRRDLLSKRL